MNKKFLSAILFGALMVTSTGTFVSCKDYDDDIDSLNEKVDKLTKDLSELQAAAGKYVTAVKYDAATGKLTVTGGNGETFQLPMPAELPTYSLKVVDGKIQLLDGDKVVSEAPLPTTDAPAAFDPTLLKWNNGYLYYGDVKISGVEKPQSVGSITEVKDEETGEVIGYVIELDGKSATFSVVTDLKALVFEPELYYQGIEAIAVKSFVYKALTAKDVNADADNKDDAPVQETATTEVTPELSATYHMNPSTADVRNLVKEDLKFLDELKNSDLLNEQSIVNTLKEEINLNIKAMSELIDSLAINFPRAYKHALTLKSIRMLLSNERRTIKQMESNGVISEKDAEGLLEKVDERTDELNTFRYTIPGTILRRLFRKSSKEL